MTINSGTNEVRCHIFFHITNIMPELAKTSQLLHHCTRLLTIKLNEHGYIAAKIKVTTT